MDIELLWDDDEETIVRWAFHGMVGMIDYMIPINETAARGMMNGGKVDTIVNIGWRIPLPNRPMQELKKPIFAARSYGLGITVLVIKNPITRAVIALTLGRDPELDEAMFVIGSVDAARALIHDKRANPPE